MGDMNDLLELADSENQANLDADIDAQQEDADRDIDDLLEAQAMDQSHKDEAEGLANYNQDQWQNMAQIINKIQEQANAAKKQDEKKRKRENALRYITGLGDTLASVANLIGVAHGASNQKQTYNASKVVEKAEAARKARKLEMDDLNRRLDEMKAQQRDMKAAGSLKEVELKARQDKEKAALLAQQRAKAEAAKRYADEQAYRAMKDARDDWKTMMAMKRAEEEAARREEATKNEYAWRSEENEKERQWRAGQNEEERQWRAGQNEKDRASRVTMNDANNAAKLVLEASKQASKQASKNAKDPKYKARKLNENITGIRDELAQSMGYTDYNEYLRYENVSGWGQEIEGQRDRESKKIRKQRAAQKPEIVELLRNLKNPDILSEEQIQRYMSASKVFADAVQAGDQINRGDDGRIKADY